MDHCESGDSDEGSVGKPRDLCIGDVGQETRLSDGSNVEIGQL